MRLRSLLPALLVALIALTAFGNLPGDRRIYIEAQDSAHAYAFVAVVLMILHLWPGKRGGIAAYARAFGIALALGTAIELIQGLTGRDASASDVLRDALGALAGLCLHAAFGHLPLERPRTGSKPHTRSKMALLAIAVAALGYATWPTATVAADMVRKAREFPVIARFPAPLHRHLDRGRFPRISLDEPYPDWRGYRTLVVELGNPHPRESLSLTLRVHDRGHNQEFHDRYNRRYTLPPASREQWRIALSDIQSAPRGRAMDMSRIAGIVIYAQGPLPGREFYLEGVWLE